MLNSLNPTAGFVIHGPREVGWGCSLCSDTCAARRDTGMKLLLKTAYVLVLAGGSGANGTEPCRDPGPCMAPVKPEGCCHWSAKHMGN